MIGGLAPSLCASAVLRVGEYTWRFAGLSKCLGASLGGLDLGELYSKKAVVVAVIKILWKPNPPQNTNPCCCCLEFC